MIILIGGSMHRSIILISIGCLVFWPGTLSYGQFNGDCGCEVIEPAQSGQTVSVQLNIDNDSRSYLLYVPKGYSPGEAIPLIIAFHGWTDSPSGMKRGSGLTKTADAYGFAVAFPEGINYPEAKRGWAFPGCNASPPVGKSDEFGRQAVCEIGNRYDCDTTTCPSTIAQDQCTESALNSDWGGGPEPEPACSYEQTICEMGFNDNCNWCGCLDDEAFTRAVITDVASRVCIDLTRIYATGMSAGGMMTSWLIGQMDDVFAAYAPMSGTNPRDFYNLPPADADISVMWIHGTRDSTVPHDGSRASDGYLYEGAEAEVKRLGNRLGCNESPLTPYEWARESVQAPSSSDLDCQQCQFPSGDERQVAYCLWDGGHSYPKGPGSRESAFWGNRLMVEFFLGHNKSNPSPDLCEPPSPPPPSEETGSIQGVVYLEGTRTKEASVTASNSNGVLLSAPVSKAGKFTFRLVPVGPWELEASNSACSSGPVPVEVLADSTVKQNLNITCP
jgi:poly(3-hydroxybutyrate) depolymerase